MHSKFNIFIGILMIVSGYLFFITDPQSIPLAIQYMLGDIGYFAMCGGFIVGGIGMIVFPLLTPLWITPIYIYVLGAASLMQLEQPLEQLKTSFTAYPFYASGAYFLLYIWARGIVDFKLLTVRRVMIPFLSMMFIVLIEHWDKASMDSFFSMVNLFTFDTVNPVTFYRVGYLLSILGLIGMEINPKVSNGRLAMQYSGILFVAHGLTFSLIAFKFGSFQFIPMLIMPAFLWLIIPIGDIHD